MDRNILKEALIGVNGRRDVDLLVSLSKQHYDELENGSGNALNPNRSLEIVKSVVKFVTN